MKPQYSFTLGIDGSGIDEMIRGLEEYQRWLKEKRVELRKRLSDIGLEAAEIGFSAAQYDGTPDADVTLEERNENTTAIVAVGSTVLFIEFGTGIKFPDAHPEKDNAKAQGMVGRGEYGHGLGKLPGGWRYPAAFGAGTNGVEDPKHPGYIHTYGNPANMPMYNSAKQLRETIADLVREVFV